MLSCILQSCVSEGWCRVHADNLYIMGLTMEETVTHWKLVLDLMLKNNLKLSASKAYGFPLRLDLLGWIKQDQYLIPDAHRQSCLVNAKLPETVKDLRSFLGSYRTFYRCKKDM